MSSQPDKAPCGQAELVALYSLRALPPGEMSAVRAHLDVCAQCRQELQALHPVVDALVFWPADVLRPPESMWERLERRISAEAHAEPASSATQPWPEPEWDEVGPGISVKLLATDAERDRVSMLVRLAPGVDYPPHTHAGTEELHLLSGELWINDHKLRPGDYSRAEPGTIDHRVWSETGCTCVLVTSRLDAIL